MRAQAGFFDVDERLKQLSAKVSSLEALSAVIDSKFFERFWSGPCRACPARKAGGRRSITALARAGFLR